jgi:hypothetical protein
MKLFSILRHIPIVVALLLSSCAFPPRTGDIVHARVIRIVNESEFEKARSNTQGDLTTEILYAISQGVTINDIRNRRLVLLSCRWGSNSGEHFLVLLPEGLQIPYGDRVDLELEAGIPSKESRPGTFSKFRKVLPSREKGRTDCDPTRNFPLS